MPGDFRNRLMAMYNNPEGFSGTPGFQFALNSGTQAVNRRAAAGGIRGSGNALAELVRYGTGLAQQDYGNEVDRLGRLYATEDAGEIAREHNANELTLGQGQLSLGRDRLGLDSELGRGALGVSRDRLGLDRDLGYGRLGLDASLGYGSLANTRRGQDMDFSLGSTRAGNDYDLGRRGIDSTNQRNRWDYDLGSQAAETNRYNSRTNRGMAQSNAWYQQDQRRGFWNPPSGRPPGSY